MNGTYNMRAYAIHSICLPDERRRDAPVKGVVHRPLPTRPNHHPANLRSYDVCTMKFCRLRCFYVPVFSFIQRQFDRFLHDMRWHLQRARHHIETGKILILLIK